MRKNTAFPLLVLLFTAALTAIIGCSRSSQKMSSGVALDRGEVVLALLQEGVSPLNIQLSSLSYGEVNEAAIPSLVEEFRADLSKKGIPVSDITGATGYDARFQCTGFSDFFAGGTAARMSGELWHSTLKVNRPAIFVVWYHQDTAPAGLDHAINVLIVSGPQGRRCVWLEPQTGRRLTLSATEKATARPRA